MSGGHFIFGRSHKYVGIFFKSARRVISKIMENHSTILLNSLFDGTELLVFVPKCTYFQVHLRVGTHLQGAYNTILVKGFILGREYDTILHKHYPLDKGYLCLYLKKYLKKGKRFLYIIVAFMAIITKCQK